MNLLAADPTDPIEFLKGVQGGSGVPSSGVSTLSSLAIMLFNIAVGVGFGISMVAIALSSLQLVQSEGDPKRVKKAIDSLAWSIAGGVISIGAWAFKNILLNALGVTDSSLVNGPSL